MRIALTLVAATIAATLHAGEPTAIAKEKARAWLEARRAETLDAAKGRVQSAQDAIRKSGYTKENTDRLSRAKKQYEETKAGYKLDRPLTNRIVFIDARGEVADYGIHSPSVVESATGEGTLIRVLNVPDNLTSWGFKLARSPSAGRIVVTGKPLGKEGQGVTPSGYFLYVDEWNKQGVPIATPLTVRE